ncbi:hypothetical protein BDV41DRAFT_542954 [Aspergillus transmontanensis]|uniref:Uncharacterized protein n=1 Tax=Aspergillus transmontanensis TaxID=1034304 RepID=A0A5N6VR41_9EURO|nr:hypothetical protein BDV41DRAFT_542954 [Aspergillus transmontanensis]
MRRKHHQPLEITKLWLIFQMSGVEDRLCMDMWGRLVRHAFHTWFQLLFHSFFRLGVKNISIALVGMSSAMLLPLSIGLSDPNIPSG